MTDLVVFDLDGTLITSGIDYGRAEFKFGLLMLDVLEHRAPHYNEIIKLSMAIDKERVKEMKAHRDRFPGSLVLCYHQLCERSGLAIDRQVEKQIWEIGYSALSEETYRNRGMIPAAEDTLLALQKAGALLYCVTKGDARVQWMKYRGYQLGRFFPRQDRFRVVKWEKATTLKRILAECQQKIERAYMVGDEVKGDLWAAHQAGLTPVHIPHPSIWDNGEVVDEKPPGTLTLKKITDLPSLLYQPTLL